MISPLLEVQLKPHHQPISLRLAWHDLLGKFTLADPEQRADDEPLLMLRRSVTLSKARQRVLLRDPGCGDKLRELLLLDARESILTGKYPCRRTTALELAALDMALTWGPYNSKCHSQAFLRDHLDDFLPEHHISSVASTTLFGHALPGLKGSEATLLSRYSAVSEESPDGLQSRYLDLVSRLPYYGAAFFCGQVERPPPDAKKGRRLTLKRSISSDLPVVIAVSREYLCLVDKESHSVLLLQSLLDLSWRVSDPSSKTPSPSSGPSGEGGDPESALPSLFLYFPAEETSESESSRLVQVFSRQSVMVEALLNALIQAACQEEQAEEEMQELLEGPLFPGVEEVGESESVREKLERLCVASFGTDGECVAAKGSLAAVLCPPAPGST